MSLEKPGQIDVGNRGAVGDHERLAVVSRRDVEHTAGRASGHRVLEVREVRLFLATGLEPGRQCLGVSVPADGHARDTGLLERRQTIGDQPAGVPPEPERVPEADRISSWSRDTCRPR